MRRDTNDRLTREQVFVQYRNDFSARSVPHHDIAAFKQIRLLGKSLGHATAQNNNAVGIFAADAMDILPILRVSGSSDRTGINDTDIARAEILCLLISG